MDTAKGVTRRSRRKPVVRNTLPFNERLQLRDILSMVHFYDPAAQTLANKAAPLVAEKGGGEGRGLLAPEGTMRCNDCGVMVCAAQAGIKGNARVTRGYRVTCTACKTRLQ